MEGTQSLTEKHSNWTKEGKVESSKPIGTIASGQHSLRCLGRGWALRLRLWRVSYGERTSMETVWRQPEGARECCAKAGDLSATAHGIQEEVWPHRRSKAPLLGRAK